MNKNQKKTAKQRPLVLDLKRNYFIESSRYLPRLPKSHPCSRMHGHSFAIEFSFHGPIDPKLGWVMDYSEIDSKLAKTLARVDHCTLNDIKGLENPTTEMICVWLFETVSRDFNASVKLAKVSIRETRDSECSYPSSFNQV